MGKVCGCGWKRRAGRSDGSGSGSQEGMTEGTVVVVSVEEVPTSLNVPGVESLLSRGREYKC